jgi:hypothetical protein
MASSKTRRRSRKARAARPVPAAEAAPAQNPSRPAVAPRVAPQAKAVSGRRQQREERERQAAHDRAQANRSLGTYGERPRSIFDPIPVSEIAILAGLVAVVVGVLSGGGPALIVGAIVCGLGVVEFTAREHFSGYRSHASLLAAVPAVLVEVLLALFVGVPTRRVLLLAPVIPVFAFSFWLLHRAFANARHLRVAKPPAP